MRWQISVPFLFFNCDNTTVGKCTYYVCNIYRSNRIICAYWFTWQNNHPLQKIRNAEIRFFRRKLVVFMISVVILPRRWNLSWFICDQNYIVHYYGCLYCVIFRCINKDKNLPGKWKLSRNQVRKIIFSYSFLEYSRQLQWIW